MSMALMVIALWLQWCRAGQDQRQRQNLWRRRRNRAQLPMSLRHCSRDGFAAGTKTLSCQIPDCLQAQVAKRAMTVAS